MKRNNFRKKVLLVMLALVMTVAVSGCSKETSGSVSTGGQNTGNGGLSRAEYIGLLSNSFGYNSFESETAVFSDVAASDTYYPQIQAAAEWQIIDTADKFEPGKGATLAFALESAVRAVGTDDIEASGATVDSSNLADFYVKNIAQIDLSNPDSSIDSATAQQIIDLAKEYSHNLVLPQVVEINLVDGVKSAESGVVLNADGTTGLLPPGNEYSVGDIIYIEATDTSLARAVKVASINADNTFTYSEATVEETYESLNIHGTFQGGIVEAVSASDGTVVGLAQDIYDEMKSYDMASKGRYVPVQIKNSSKVDASGDHMVFTAQFDVQQSATITNRNKLNYSNLPDGVSHPDFDNEGKVKAAANGNLVVGIKNIRADVDYETEPFHVLKPKKMKLSLHYDTEISTDIHGSVSASIPLGEAYIQIAGPVNIRVMLTAHLGADGNVTISYTTQNVMAVGWQKGSGLQNNFDSKADAHCDMDATLTAEATVLIDLRVGFKNLSYSLTNAQVTSGAVGVAKMEADLLGDQPTCVDIQVYVPLRWGVNQEGCLITDINNKWKAKGTVWDSSNSPINLHFHLEDWVRTEGDVCTRSEKVEQELVTPEGEPLEEIDPFEFEPLEFDFIELVSYTMFVKQGSSMEIGFTNIPEGYTKEDLKYEVVDPSICSVSNGTVQANKDGSTIVKISTSDGLFTVSLADGSSGYMDSLLHLSNVADCYQKKY